MGRKRATVEKMAQLSSEASKARRALAATAAEAMAKYRRDYADAEERATLLMRTVEDQGSQIGALTSQRNRMQESCFEAIREAAGFIERLGEEDFAQTVLGEATWVEMRVWLNSMIVREALRVREREEPSE